MSENMTAEEGRAYTDGWRAMAAMAAGRLPGDTLSMLAKPSSSGYRDCVNAILAGRDIYWCLAPATPIEWADVDGLIEAWRWKCGTLTKGGDDA